LTLFGNGSKIIPVSLNLSGVILMKNKNIIIIIAVVFVVVIILGATIMANIHVDKEVIDETPLRKVTEQITDDETQESNEVEEPENTLASAN
jgi:flagellar basal body-associated protein FliL